MNDLPATESTNRSDSGEINWDDFRVFVEVVRTGSFNRAATRLKTTQATVSRRLQRLEVAIGARLFERDRRGPRLTFEGQRIYNDAHAAHFALARAVSLAGSASSRIEGDCKLLMGDGIASYWMARFLAPFYTRHPNIELRLFGAYDTAAEKRETFDLHVHYYEPAEIEPDAIRLGTMHFMPFASRDYLRAHGIPKSVDDLERHRVLDLAIYRADMGAWASWSQDDANKHTVLLTNLSACLAEAVRHGAGVALLPTYAPVVDECFVPLDIGVHFQAPIYASYRRDAMKKWAVRATADFLRNIVFDRKNVPWFKDAFAVPADDWKQKLESLLTDAARPVAKPGAEEHRENAE